MCIALIALATPLRAAENGISSRWTPSLSLGFDVQNQSAESEFDSSFGIAGTEGRTILSPVFGFGVSLRTPTLLRGAGQPRIVIHAGGQVSLSESQSLLEVDEQFLFVDTDVDQFCPTGDPNIDSCDQSGRMDLTQDFAWFAGVGVEFRLPVAERQFAIRPSIDYFGQSLQFDGRAERIDRSSPNGDIFQTTTISASSSELTHAVGPRITFEVETMRLGAFSLNVFVEGQFYWILSNRDFGFAGASGSESADFRVKLDPLVAQGGAGLRIVWTGD